jgi:hypothetical protein
MPTIYGAIDLSKNELRNAVVQNLPSAPSSPVKGQIYYDTVGNILYWYNGSGWVAAQGGAGAVPATTVTTEAVGDAPVVGVATTYAREDHKHGREAFGAITAQTAFGAASGNGAAATVTRSDHTHGTPVHDNAAHATIALSALAVPTAAVSFNGQLITNVATPVAGTDGANKSYVDNLIAGLSWKDNAVVLAASNVTQSGYSTIDGVTIAGAARVLCIGQTTPAQNGLWTAAAGAWTRATDADVDTELANAAVWVEQGTTYADTAWVCTNNPPFTVGSTSLTWVQFAGGGSVTAGAGMTQVGNTLNVITGDTSLVVNADEVHVNTAVIATVASVTAAVAAKATKFAAALTGTASPEVITHNLNTRDVQVTILNGASPYTGVEVDWDATTVNTVTIRYTPNLGAGYRAVVVG